MWLQAIITPSDLEHVLNEITPMRMPLDGDAPDRYLWLERPSHVAMTNGHGIRIVTSARRLTVPTDLRRYMRRSFICTSPDQWAANARTQVERYRS